MLQVASGWEPMNIEEEQSKRHLLEELVLQHRALDEMITQAAEEAVYVDQLQTRRLKKKKLQLKDQIEQLRSSLIPDLDA